MFPFAVNLKGYECALQRVMRKAVEPISNKDLLELSAFSEPKKRKSIQTMRHKIRNF